MEGPDGRVRSTAVRDPLKGPFSMAKPELLKQFDLMGDSLEDKVNDFLQGDSIDKVDEILRDSVIDFEEEKIYIQPPSVCILFLSLSLSLGMC